VLFLNWFWLKNNVGVLEMVIGITRAPDGNLLAFREGR